MLMLQKLKFYKHAQCHTKLGAVLVYTFFRSNLFRLFYAWTKEISTWTQIRGHIYGTSITIILDPLPH